MEERKSKKVQKLWMVGALAAILGSAACDQIPVLGSAELEGTVESNDCRAQILTKQGAPETQGKKFVCSYLRSDSGKIMGGVCTAVETEGKVCLRAYTYPKEPWTKCYEHSSLQRDDKCHPDVGFAWNEAHKIFEAIKCPEHSTLQGSQCYADVGFVWNKDGTQLEAIICPEHSTLHGNECSLDAGFMWNRDHSEAAAKCPEHSTFEADGRCRVDEGFYWNPLSSRVEAGEASSDPTAWMRSRYFRPEEAVSGHGTPSDLVPAK